jgi:hypothetical protein
MVGEEKSAVESLVARLKNELEIRSNELQDARARLETEKDERKRDHLQHRVEMEGEQYFIFQNLKDPQG